MILEHKIPYNLSSESIAVDFLALGLNRHESLITSVLVRALCTLPLIYPLSKAMLGTRRRISARAQQNLDPIAADNVDSVCSPKTTKPKDLYSTRISTSGGSLDARFGPATRAALQKRQSTKSVVGLRTVPRIQTALRPLPSRGNVELETRTGRQRRSKPSQVREA